MFEIIVNLCKNSVFYKNLHTILPICFIIWLICNFYQRGKNRISEIEQETEHENVSDDYTPALEEKEHIRYYGATRILTGGAAEFYEIMSNRRSVRSFCRQRSPPDPAIIEMCIKTAALAPSGAHTEPWTFCLVTESNLKRAIRIIVEKEEKLNYAHRMHRQWTADLRPLKTDYIKPYLTDAPYLLLVFKQIYGILPNGQRRQHYYNEISTSIAVGILIAALQTAGLCSLVTTPLNCGPALRDLLKRPCNEKLLVLMPIGYADENCLVPDFQRKPISEILIKYE